MGLTAAANDTGNPGCFICRKHRGEILLPGGAIAEDDVVYVGHAPIRPDQSATYLGYLMVEPKRHAPGLENLHDDEARALGSWVARLSRALVATERADHVYAFVLGDTVPNVHVHVVARYPGAPAEYRGPRVDKWPEAPRGGPAEIEAICARLRDWLNSSEGKQPDR
jgi:diadenosine tetraphosphate (Ap4A) HIT family hydrolase